MDRTPHLLRLDALGLDVFQLQDQQVRPLARFSAGEAERFRDWLRQRDLRRPLHAVVELADESFEIEDLPRLRGADRRALLQRRKMSWFADPQFAGAAALPQARESLPAHAERVLFSGLARADAITSWLDALRDCGAALQRVLPASQLAAHFGAGAHAAGAVLVVHFSRAGMRLTAALEGQALFARLATDFSAQTVHTDAGWIDELARTLHYLSSRRDLSLPGEPAIVVHADEERIAAAALARADARFGARLRFSSLPADAQDFDAASTAQLLRWLAAAPPRLGWGAGSRLNGPRSQQLTLALVGAALAASVAGASLGVLHWQDARRDKAARQQVQQRHALIRQTLAGLETGSAHARLRAQRLLATLEHPALAQPRLSTTALFRLLAAALQDFPGHQLQSLDWHTDDFSADSDGAWIRVEISLTTAASATAAAVLDALRAQGARGPRLLGNAAGLLRVGFELPAARLGGAAG